MALRLNEGHRSQLRTLRDKIVACPDEQQAEREAYAAAAPLVRKMVEAVYPPADMATCRKYDVAWVDDCIKMTFTNGVVDLFRFDDGTGPVVCKKTTSGKMYLADIETSEAVAAWVAARAALKVATQRKRDDYESLIYHARTLEEIVVIWPEADSLRGAFGQPLSVLSDDIRNRIKADVARRAATA